MTPDQKEAFRREVLLPCPFCGSHEIMTSCDPDEGRDNSGPSRRIQCAGCNVEAPYYPSKAEAVVAWNRRALAASQPAPAADTGQAVAWDILTLEGELTQHYRNEREARQHVEAGLYVGKRVIRPLYPAQPAPLDAERVREEERSAFEAWASNGAELHRHNGAEYSSHMTQLAWAAWQARAALRQTEGEA